MVELAMVMAALSLGLSGYAFYRTRKGPTETVEKLTEILKKMEKDGGRLYRIDPIHSDQIMYWRGR